MKKLIKVTSIAVIGLLLLAGCAGKTNSNDVENNNTASLIYNDGTYEGRSDDDERGNYGIVTLEIKSDKITKAEYKGYLSNGVQKDENYGKIIDEKTGEIDPKTYEIAQQSLSGIASFGPRLVEVQNVEDVDVVTGATHSHADFIVAVNRALDKAKK